jgi:hypothetical protein
METIDITSDRLREQGYNLQKEGHSVVLHSINNGMYGKRFTIYKEWDRTQRNTEQKLADAGFSQEIIQYVVAAMSDNYDKLMTTNGSAATASATSKNGSSSYADSETIALTPDLTREVDWQEISAILSTSIKRDEDPKLITFCGMLLAQTHDDQLNLGFQAESSVGKSYIPLDVATYFPESEILKIASASPTAFYHSGTWDDERKALIVDLRGKILIFLDMPHFQLLERLRPMLSHDDPELNYKITDKSQKYGLRTKDVIIKGPPSVFFCSAKTNPDDQEKTRLILVSPSTDEGKLKESLELLTLKKSDPEEYKRRIMRDPKRVWLTKRIMCVRQGDIQEVKIPNEGKAVYERFIKDHLHLMPRHQRDYPRIFSFIKAHALLNCFNREKVSEDTIMANEKDIDAGFQMYKGIGQSNEMGLSPYVLKIYDDVFMPILNPNQGVSREDILKQYYKARHKSISPEVLRLEILPQLEAVGLIYQEEGERRKMQWRINRQRYPITKKHFMKTAE